MEKIFRVAQFRALLPDKPLAMFQLGAVIDKPRGDDMTKKKKLNKAQRNAILNRARAKWIACARADRIWKAIVGIGGVTAEHRQTFVDRLRSRARRKPTLAPVVSAIARAAKF